MSYRSHYAKTADGALLLKHAEVRYVGTGRVVVDNKGNPVKQYEPFFTPTLDWDSDQQLASLGTTPLLRYDPLGRLVRVDEPDGSYSTTEWSPWHQTVWDQDDTVLDSAWYAARMNLPEGDEQRRAAEQTAQLAKTPSSELFDSQGRVVRQVELLTRTDDDGAGKFDAIGEPETQRQETRLVLDIEGNVLAVIDPRGLMVQRDVFDLTGATLLSRNPDAGPVWLLEDASDQPLLSVDGRGVVTTFHYDELRRPTMVRVRTEPGAPWRVVEATTYGEAVPDAAARNLRGEAALSFDEAGLEEAGGFDFVGNPLSQSRLLRAEPFGPVDWSEVAAAASYAQQRQVAAPLLEPPSETLTLNWSWNALGSPITQTTPDGSVTQQLYDAGGALKVVQLRHRGVGPWTEPVSNITYNARGQRDRVVYGNQTSTRYSYDPETFRVTRIRTTDGSGAALQDLGLLYDPLGNVLARTDAAQAKLFFDNAQVSADSGYVYDSLYRLIVATGREAAQPAPLSNLSWEPGYAEQPNPNADAVRRFVERYTYDEVGNLVTIRHSAKGAGASWTRGFVLQGQGGPGQGIALSNRLKEVQQGLTVRSYDYDGAGNMAGLATGNTLSWNAEGLLERAGLGGGGEAVYGYDADGDRVAKVVRAHGGSSRQVVELGGWERLRRFAPGGQLQDEEQLLAVSDGTAVVLRIATQTQSTGGAPDGGGGVPGVGVPQWRYELADQLGSRCVYVDGDGGVLGRVEYLPYGAVSYRSWAGTAPGGIALKYRFNGKGWDEETGLLNYGARLYAPWLGRWTAPDPSGFVDGLSLYVYVRGSPVTFVDPDGRLAAIHLGRRTAQRHRQAGNKLTREVSQGGFYKGKRTAVGEMVAVGIGLTPYAGPAADARDIVAAGVAFASRPALGTAADLVMAGIGVVPGTGDAVKAGWRLGGRRLLEGAAQAIPGAYKKVRQTASGLTDRGVAWMSKVRESAKKRLDKAKAAVEAAKAKLTRAVGGGKTPEPGGGGGGRDRRQKATERELSSGRKATTHGAERMAERGFSDDTVENIVTNNTRGRQSKVDAQGRKTWEYTDTRGNTVVTNEAGDVVTGGCQELRVSGKRVGSSAGEETNDGKQATTADPTTAGNRGRPERIAG